jgi:predicted enzyme related to lactoylglutathione lyase
MNSVIHFEILANDPERLIAFYRDALGWEAAAGPGRYWPVKTHDAGQPGIDGGFMHRHFPQSVINTCSVESLEEALLAIRREGGELAHGPNDIPGVGRHAYCRDPEGNLFGVIERFPSA